MFRLILATTIGWVLGKERKRHESSGGGSRTLAIVALVSCLLAILTLEIADKIHPVTHNFTRLISYELVGLGFLCSAVITKSKKGIDGLTTATSIFAIIPISFCIGFRFYFYGITSAIILYLILESKYWNNKEV